MANYSNLKAAIAAAIKANGNQEITGQLLQDVLTSMVSVIGANYTFAGVATPATNPGTPDQNVVYMASQAGTYTNFNGTVLPAGIHLLMWNGTWTSNTVMCGDGGVFDISVYKASGGTLAKFADLAAALDGGNNIPASARKGGMSVKFVQSSDNKYIQCRCMAQNFTTDVTQWQGVDDEPTAGSDNLVKSGGIAKYTGLSYPYIDKTVSISGKNSTSLSGQSSGIRLIPNRGYKVKLVSHNPTYSGTSAGAMIQVYMRTDDGNTYKYPALWNINNSYAGTEIELSTIIVPEEPVTLQTLTRLTNDSTIELSAEPIVDEYYDNDYNKNINITSLKLQNSTIYAGSGEIHDSTTRVIAIIPSGNASSITVKPATGYKITVTGSSSFYKDFEGVSAIENYVELKSYVTTQTEVQIPDNIKTLIVIFAKTDNSTITQREVWNNFEISTTTFKDKQVLINEQNAKDNEYRYLQIYNNENDTLEIEETFIDGGSIYLHNTRYAAYLTSATRIDISSNTAFATLLGVSTVTSPQGYENCIEIENGKNLVFNIDNNQFYIRSREVHNTNETLLISCVGGRIRYLSNQFVSAVILPRAQKIEKKIATLSDYSSAIVPEKIIRATIYGSTGQVASSTSRCVAVLSYKDLFAFGKIGCTVSEGYKINYQPLGVDTNGRTIEVGDTLSLLGKETGWKTGSSFYLDLTSDIKSVGIIFAKVNDSYITISEVKNNFSLIGVNNKSVVQGEIDLSVYPILENNVMKKADAYNALFKGLTGSVETLIFFSDPHWYGYLGTEADEYSVAHLKEAAKTYLHNMKAMYDATPVDCVVCGGDWLTAHKQSVAVKALGQIDGFMKQLFGDKYYPLNGNHDNNYQGEKDDTESTSANDGALTNQQMINLWFRRWGKMYYTFHGSNSRFYVFDSGIDWPTAMDSYKWEQIDWFANQLLQNSDDNIILVSHIVELNYQEPSQFGNNITPIVDNVLLIADAFNSRTSITLNGQTYDFSQKSGKVKCLLGGHLHFDASAVIHNIPVKCVTTSMSGVFDVLLFDYGNNKLQSIRFGGSNWNMNIVS